MASQATAHGGGRKNGAHPPSESLGRRTNEKGTEMSFYSNVSIMTTKAGEQRLRAEADAAATAIGVTRKWLSVNPDEEIESPKATKYGEDCILLEWEWVKFYDTFKETIALKEAIEKVRDEGYPVEFCRTGEETDDYEDDGVQEGMKAHIEILNVINVYFD